jgi:ELWxxDGT repeat protein
MPHAARLQVAQLEEREVPAAALFADIVPGIWGSYPLNLTPSGSTLFFSADNGHGYELYATDGTPGSAHLVKDIKPGLGGSNPGRFFNADNGVVYFAADDGTGRAMWRSDGTAAGTKKVPGIPATANLDLLIGIGHNGELYFTTGNTAANPTGTGPIQWWKTDGTTTTLLHTFAGAPDISTKLDAVNGQVVLVRQYSPSDQFESVWKTDGTAAGTTLWQQRLTAYDFRIGWATLSAGVEIAPGKFVHANLGFTQSNSALWVSNGVDPGSATAFALPGTTSAQSYIASAPVLFGGKAYVAVQSPDPSVAGLWVTDGTAGGTHRLDLPLGTGLLSLFALTPFNGRLLVQRGATLTGITYYVTDGTPAGTTELPRPAGATGQLNLGGMIPPGPGEPLGAILVSDAGGRLFRTDGTAAGTAWIDPTGLPSGYKQGYPSSFTNDGFGRVVQPYTAGGVYFNGALYFPSANGDQRPELWKWDAPAPAGSQTVAPKVLDVTVNDGSAQRSVVSKLTVTFDRVVNLAAFGAVTLVNTSGFTPLEYVLTLNAQTVDGRTVLTIPLGTNYWPIDDGRYTLTIKAGKVTDAATGGAMAADYTFNFTKLFGDLNGDGTYDRDARWMVHNSIGLHVGDAGYLAALDWNNDGVIDATDELAAVRNWGKSV